MNKDKLKKVIAGDATEEETSQAMNWIGSEEGAEALSGLIQEDADRAGENFIKTWAPEVPDRLNSNFYRWLYGRTERRHGWLKVAAALVPLIIISAVALFFAAEAGALKSAEFIEASADRGKQMQVVLSDGTLVELNSGSRLRYPKQFALFHRDVQLEGEAYFTVAKNRMKPFKVSVGNVSIKVTGTQFNVEAYKEKHFINVLLDKGSVTLVTPTGEISMKPSQYVSYNKLTGACSLRDINRKDSSPAAWRRNVLSFHRTPLGEILDIVSRERNVKFIVKDSTLLESRFTLTSDNEYTVNILHDIEAVSNVRFTPAEGSRNTYIVTK